MRSCRLVSITPDLANASTDASNYNESIYLLRCQFSQPTLDVPYPFLIGMDLTARASGAQVSLFQLLLKGYRATVLSQV